LIPKFEIKFFDGEYKTRSQFYRELRKYIKNIDNGVPVEQKDFGFIAFYGADFTEFIEKCKKLEK